MDRKRKILKQAIQARDEARAVRNFSRSNRLNFLIYLIAHAGDTSPQSLDTLEQELLPREAQA